jgi:hypothetical protein
VPEDVETVEKTVGKTVTDPAVTEKAGVTETAVIPEAVPEVAW